MIDLHDPPEPLCEGVLLRLADTKRRADDDEAVRLGLIPPAEFAIGDAAVRPGTLFVTVTDRFWSETLSTWRYSIRYKDGSGSFWWSEHDLGKP